MKTSLLPFILIAVLWNCNPMYAQEKWSAEFRPGVNFPVSEEATKTGFGFGLVIGYAVKPQFGAYAGWGWNQFKSNHQDFGATNYSIEETGYTFGVQFIHPSASVSGLSYILRFGGIYTHIEIENFSGAMLAESAHGFGWEVGAGLAIGFGKTWSLRPQIGYRSLSREMEMEALVRDFDLDYIVMGFGIAKKF